MGDVRKDVTFKNGGDLLEVEVPRRHAMFLVVSKELLNLGALFGGRELGDLSISRNEMGTQSL